MQEASQGLTSADVRERLIKFGLNVLPEKPKPTDLAIFVSQLKSPLVYILIAAGIITLVLKEFADSIVIFFAVFINTILGFVQERRAEKAFEALSKLVQSHARVIRDWKLELIDASRI